MKSQKHDRDAFERATAWLEHTEHLSLEELREMRRLLGHDVERSEKEFVAFLSELPGQHTAEEPKPFAILSRAAQKGLSLVQLANAVELSVTLVTKLDRRLIKFSSIPALVLNKIAQTLGVSDSVISAYLQQGAAFAAGAHYHAGEAPTLPEPQDFFDAVRSDKTLSEPRRKLLLQLRAE